MNMENFNELDFEDDEFAESNEPQQEKSLTLEEPILEEPILEEEESGDLTSEVLRLRGINDPQKIKFEDESGAIVERAWDSLTRDEQINILSDLTEQNYDLDDEEILLLNNIRNSGLSVRNYLELLQPKPQESKTYDIDLLSDEDLYALDLLDKVGSDNITDEEISEAVETAKKNEKLFQKTVEGLRNEYIKLLKDLEIQRANEEAVKQQEAYNLFASSINNLIRGLNSFAGRLLELSDEDKNNLSDFMLNLDDQGTSAFGRALLDPELFTKAAFWLLNEEEIIGELTKLMLDSYLRGYETAKQDFQNKSKVVYNPKKEQTNLKLDFDDDWD